MLSFTLGVTDADHLTVYIVSAPGADCGHYYNNISVDVQVKAGGFKCNYETYFQLYEFTRLRDDFYHLCNSLSGAIKFGTMEGDFQMEISGDKKGHFEIRGVVGDTNFVTNQLHFYLQIDQSFIPQILRDLDGIIKRFSV